MLEFFGNRINVFNKCILLSLDLQNTILKKQINVHALNPLLHLVVPKRHSAVELQWLKHRWLVYHGYFLLVFEALEIFYIFILGIMRVEISYFILKMYVMCT